MITRFVQYISFVGFVLTPVFTDMKGLYVGGMMFASAVALGVLAERIKG